MDKQSYQLINNINTKLLQLEWIKKELKYITYEFSKLLKLFFIQKFIFYIIAISLSVSGLRT
jgi:lysine/ornithine N-monooxygenase